MSISKDNLAFLNELTLNNNRDWFNENKSWYQTSHENTIQTCDEILQLLKEIDHIETPNGKKSLYRIYKDVRFSKDKSPYKTHWGAYFKRATAYRRGGFYLHIEPENSFIGGGFYQFNKEDLKRVRDDISMDATELRAILNNKDLLDTFGGVWGEQLKTVPRGYAKDHPNVDLLRYKQFLFSRKVSDKELLNNNFPKKVVETFSVLLPFFDYMSHVLTTDANGEPLPLDQITA